MEPLVSVIIPTFQRETLLQEAISSVRAQTYSNWELIIVCDGCSCKLQFDDKRITHHQLAKNMGKSAAINYAIPFLSGKYIWMLDDDDFACPDKLQKDVACLESHPDKHFVYSKAIVTNLEMNQFGLSQGVGCSSQMLCFLTLVSPGLPLQMGTLLVQQDVLSALRFDESLRLSQDTDFVLRLAFLYEGHFRDDVSIYWRFHSNNSLWTPGREQYRKLIMDKFWKTASPQLIFERAFNLKPTGILIADDSTESKAKGDCLKAMSYVSRGLWQDGAQIVTNLQEHLRNLNTNQL